MLYFTIMAKLIFLRLCPLDILRSAFIKTICLALGKVQKVPLNKLQFLPGLSLSECLKLNHKPLKIKIVMGMFTDLQWFYYGKFSTGEKLHVN